MSTLGRMYSYAKSAESERLEDFTTEALALAIAADPAPVIDVLATCGVLGAGHVSRASSFTQYPVLLEGRSGRIDLVLQIEGDAWMSEVWFENKAYAPEGADQLPFYRKVIDSRAEDGVERHLVVLAPKPISSEPNHVFISWQDLADAATVSDALLWRDLTDFLKEKRMTADAMLPITEGEADSLRDAHRLFRKMRYLLRRVNADARTTTPEWPPERWVADSRVKRALLSDFAWTGRLRLREGEGYAATIVWGAEPREAGACFVVLVEADRKMLAVRSRLLGSLEGQLEGWDRPEGRSRVLAKERPAASFANDLDAVEWFLACLGELRAAGVIGLIPTLGPGRIAVESDGDEIEGNEEVVNRFEATQTDSSGLDRVTSAD